MSASTPSGSELTSVDDSDRIGYDPTTETFHAEFDTEDGPDAAVVAVVETIGAIIGQSPTELPPLYNSIHAGALGELVSFSQGRTVITFAHEGVNVQVSNDGDIVAQRTDG